MPQPFPELPTQFPAAIAQAGETPVDRLPTPRLDDLPPSRQPLPEETLPLPPPGDLLETPATPAAPTPAPELTGDRLCISGFDVTGSTVYDPATLSAVASAAVLPDAPDCIIAPASMMNGYQVTFAQLQLARDAVTQQYIDDGYVTSGAFIPEQSLETGVVRLEVVEGAIEVIEVVGLDRLNPAYVRDRVARYTRPPLNPNTLLEGLQLLQLDPLINTLDAELAAGLTPGTNRLTITVTEANPWLLGVVLNNGRTPLVGSFQSRLEGGHRNLLGQGDRFLVDYADTDGSSSVDFQYTYPLNARNGTLSLSYGRTSSRVIEDDFDILDIRSRSEYSEITYRQPLVQTLNQEFAFSLTVSRRESESRFNPGGFGELPFPVRGSDNEGRTRITALRFSQDWLRRDARQVLALRSQFSLGIDAFGTTQNAEPPDSDFFSWRGQGQWVWLFGPDSLLLLRGNVQLSDRPLLPLEQIGIGGLGTVRGYRQDELLTDNGLNATAEVRLPIARVPEVDGLLQLIPFVDFGAGWNHDDTTPNENTLLSTGLGLGWQMQGGFSARLDYGIPLIGSTSGGDTWQEAGLLFSVQYRPF